MKKNYFKVSILAILFLSSCYDKDAFSPKGYEGMSPEEIAKVIPVSKLTTEQLSVQDYVKKIPVIAHRGTRDYAPQETDAAYRYARYVGADYLQVDLQISKDGHLVAFKDDISTSNSNVNEVFPELDKYFPEYKDIPVNYFTLEELKRLDVGTKLSTELSSSYKRKGFEGLPIITLKEVLNICEGKMPNGDPDPADQGNRPGIYVRVYDPGSNTGSIHLLKQELSDMGWYNDNLDNLKKIPTTTDKVGVANTKGRVILATQEKSSLAMLETEFKGKLPTAYWLWYSRVDNSNVEEFAEYINFGIDHGAHFICPNISDKESNDLLQIWHSNLIRRTGARIQGYVIDSKANLAKYTYNDLSESDGNIYQLDYDLTDGVITDRSDYALYFFGKYYLGEKRVPTPPVADSDSRDAVFTDLGYEK
jgi:glycerophosphoryl diester phosphodiesterase